VKRGRRCCREISSLKRTSLLEEALVSAEGEE
jgi:hypothetical protein